MKGESKTAALVASLCCVALFSFNASAQDAELKGRCAKRLAVNLLGQSPSAALLALANPQDGVDAMMLPAGPVIQTDGGVSTAFPPATPFQDRLARFVNSEFNAVPGLSNQEDSSYFYARYVLQRDLPWSEVFVGNYQIDTNGNVTPGTGQLGYFRVTAWMRRYAGNEIDGFRLPGAYRMLQNTIGIQLKPVMNTTGATSGTRQTDAVCASCHYDEVFGLDYAAKVLSRRVGTGTTMTFAAPPAGSQVFLGGQTISNDQQMMTAVINSVNFKFNTCRLAMKFAYGRSEFKCEGPAFDRCMTAFTASGKITDAIKSIVKDASYCQ